MSGLMRCTVAHWQGNTFIIPGTILSADDPSLIADFFEVFEVAQPSPAPAPASSTRKRKAS